MNEPLVAALITFRDESNFLPACLASLVDVVDCVIGYDDRSSDNSREIFLKFAPNPILVDGFPGEDWTQGGEHVVRSMLLETATEYRATHVLVIDADEAFSPSFSMTGRHQILNLRPMQKLWLPWVCTWGSVNKRAPDSSIWSRSQKDVAMVHDPSARYSAGLFHFGRTPDKPWVAYDKCAAAARTDALIHFQFAFALNAEIKQVWYMMAEFLAESRNPWEINYRYRHSIRQDFAEGVPLDSNLLPAVLPEEPNAYASWRWQQVLDWLDAYGAEYFELLNVWHIPELHKIFCSEVGHRPRRAPRRPPLKTALRWGQRRLWGKARESARQTPRQDS